MKKCILIMMCSVLSFVLLCADDSVEMLQKFTFEVQELGEGLWPEIVDEDQLDFRQKVFDYRINKAILKIKDQDLPHIWKEYSTLLPLDTFEEMLVSLDPEKAVLKENNSYILLLRDTIQALGLAGVSVFEAKPAKEISLGDAMSLSGALLVGRVPSAKGNPFLLEMLLELAVFDVDNQSDDVSLIFNIKIGQLISTLYRSDVEDQKVMQLMRELISSKMLSSQIEITILVELINRKYVGSNEFAIERLNIRRFNEYEYNILLEVLKAHLDAIDFDSLITHQMNYIQSLQDQIDFIYETNAQENTILTK
ncbi:hypothetical protein P0Y35_05960 [Kiritimatiellaeota bacterium B1221]|nr:hypothetical protein [Kiritimatiellaeota bacterium B1221]